MQWKSRHLVVWKTKLNRKPLQYWTQISNQIQRQSLCFYVTIEWVQFVLCFSVHPFGACCIFQFCCFCWLFLVDSLKSVRFAVVAKICLVPLRMRQVIHIQWICKLSPIFHFCCYFSTDYLIICRIKGGKYFNAFCWDAVIDLMQNHTYMEWIRGRASERRI